MHAHPRFLHCPAVGPDGGTVSLSAEASDCDRNGVIRSPRLPGTPWFSPFPRVIRPRIRWWTDLCSATVTSALCSPDRRKHCGSISAKMIFGEPGRRRRRRSVESKSARRPWLARPIRWRKTWRSPRFAAYSPKATPGSSSVPGWTPTRTCWSSIWKTKAPCRWLLQWCRSRDSLRRRPSRRQPPTWHSFTRPMAPIRNAVGWRSSHAPSASRRVCPPRWPRGRRRLSPRWS